MLPSAAMDVDDSSYRVPVWLGLRHLVSVEAHHHKPVISYKEHANTFESTHTTQI